jgi:hypothetical protein
MYSKLCMHKYGELTFSYSFFSVWTHKLRFLAKLLHIPKRAKNLGFFRFFRIFSFFSFFSVCFETEDPPKQFKREYIWVFFRKFRFVVKQICLFRLFRYRFETPKQTEIFCFWFNETNRNKRETNLVSVCFGSNRNLFFLFRGHPSSDHLIISGVRCWSQILNLHLQCP